MYRRGARGVLGSIFGTRVERRSLAAGERLTNFLRFAAIKLPAKRCAPISNLWTELCHPMYVTTFLTSEQSAQPRDRAYLSQAANTAIVNMIERIHAAMPTDAPQATPRTRPATTENTVSTRATEAARSYERMCERQRLQYGTSHDLVSVCITLLPRDVLADTGSSESGAAPQHAHSSGKTKRRPETSTLIVLTAEYQNPNNLRMKAPSLRLRPPFVRGTPSALETLDLKAESPMNLRHEKPPRFMRPSPQEVSGASGELSMAALWPADGPAVPGRAVGIQ
jgi:hypothetical protein